MKVFKIATDLKVCQEVRSEKVGSKASLNKQLGNRIKNWDPPVCYIHDLRVEASNFYCFGPKILFDKIAKDGLEDILEKAGQILPLEVEGAGRLYLLNLLENIDAYDKEKADKLNTEKQTKPGFKEYVFDPAKFTDSSVFKLSHFPFSPIFTYQGKLNSHDEFIGRYAELGLTGLNFFPVWTGDEVVAT